MHKNDKQREPAVRELVRAVLLLENEAEGLQFFEDICTPTELRSMIQRLEVARLLDEGMTFHEIVEKTGASTATISRINRCLLYGAGGYRTMLDKIKDGKE